MSKYIFVADMHLRFDTPECRTDDFVQSQITKLHWLSSLADKENALIVNSGDTFHKARPENGNELLNKIIMPHLPIMVGIAGNHDLLYHKMENIDKSLYGVFVDYRMAFTPIDTGEYYENDDDIIYGFNFGSEITKPEDTEGNKTIAVYHGYVSKESGFISGKVAKNMLIKNPEYDVILTGDNHETFVEEYQGRILINPGCFTRQTADKINHKPCVFLYDSETHKHEQIFIPIKNDCFDTDYLTIKKEKDERLDSFVETVNGDFEVGGNYQKNMDSYLLKNKTSDNVKDIIVECMERR